MPDAACTHASGAQGGQGARGARRVRAWLRSHPVAADALPALAGAAIMLVSGAGTELAAPGLLLSAESPGSGLAWSVALAAPMAWRRVRPKAAALAFVGVALLQILFGPVMVFGDLVTWVMLYSALVYGDADDTRRYLTLAGALGALEGIAIALAPNAGSLVSTLTGDHPYGVPQHSTQCATLYLQGLTEDCANVLLRDAAVGIAAIWASLASVAVMAFWNRARRATVLAMQERNAALEAGEAEERRIAALAERARIARDMHDVVAHTLSIIIIQSDGGRYAGAHDPAVARTTMETIRRESERALHDMKRLFGMFGGSPHADYGDLDALVATADAALRASSSGSVTRAVHGVPAPQTLGGEASVAVYRLVQEALTNARKYAGPGAHVEVHERWDADALTVTVRDDGRGASAALDGHTPGYGLIGMGERIGAVHGTVQAGPRLDGGYEVTARVPYAPYAAGHAPHTPADAGADARAATPSTATALRATPATPTAPTPIPSPAPTPALRATAVSAVDAPGVASGDAPSGGGLLDGITASLRSRPLDADGTWRDIDDADETRTGRSNAIERLSRWAQRHYLAVDTATAMLLCAFLLVGPYSGVELAGGGGASARVNVLVTCSATLPLAFRRRLPEASAGVVALAAALQLVFLPPVMYANLLALVSLYSAVTYGRERAWRWLGAAAAVDSALAGLKLLSGTSGYATIAGMLGLRYAGSGAPFGAYGGQTAGMLMGGALYGALIATLCAGTIALGRWTRSRGTNALVLRLREEALRAERDRQRVLAANMERDRIGAAIQTEVSDTLIGVIDRAVAGLAMLDAAREKGERPSPEAISDAFGAIGRQGRVALAHMRRLLGVLRETGSTDGTHQDGSDAMRLTPARSLDDQLARTSHPDLQDHVTPPEGA